MKHNAKVSAWISKRVVAARAPWRAMIALRLIRVLDVLHEHASALESARALSSRPWHPLASRPVEKSRLDPNAAFFQQAPHGRH